MTYPAGTVAMANTGQPHTGGSQFFLVYKDSPLAAQVHPVRHHQRGRHEGPGQDRQGRGAASRGQGDGARTRPW